MKTLFIISIWALPILANSQSIDLSAALSSASASRPSAQAAKSRLRQAEFQSRSIGSSPGLNLSFGYSSDQRTGGNDDDLVLSHAVDLFGRTSASRASGKALVMIAQAEYRRVTLRLQEEVVKSYTDCVGARESRNIATANEAVANKLLESIETLVREGKLPGVQATRVSIEAAKSKANRERKEREYQASLKRFRAAINVTDQTEPTDFPNLAVRSVSDEVLAESLPNLLALRAESAEANADIRVGKASRLPQFEIQGRKSSWHENSPSYGVRLQFSVPVTDSGKSQADVSAATKKFEAIKSELDDQTRIARAEVAATIDDAEGAKDQVEALTKVVETSRQLVERTQAGLKEGASNVLDILDALRALRESQEGLVAAQIDLANATAKYLSAAGSLIEVSR